ncbi:MAG: 2-C-methyl-D-erythritol 2,4-cyclodiphosphate synthase [Staphylococcus sp.]|jgi:ygbB family|nr:2-C-methyl-D-erythritol 2,4-cyclodiphosphate synthase [Staphylococcus sp.]
MKKIKAILLMAGASTRFHSNINKTIYQINQKPLYLYSLDLFYQHPQIETITVVCHRTIIDEVYETISQNYDLRKITLVEGGKTRLESVQKALSNILSDVVLIHDAARPLITKSDVDNLIEQSNFFSCGTLYHHIYDTIKQTTTEVKTINRNNLKAISTPQFFTQSLYETILKASDYCKNITDELQLFETSFDIAFVEESRKNVKVTTLDDLEYVNYILSKNNIYKIGHSFDFHPFVENRSLYLGGIKFDVGFGLMGHSDADVVYHVVAESIMGALEMGDLGTLFPDTDIQYLNKDSSYFVKEVIKKLNKESFVIENIDIIIYLEKPNLKDYKIEMAKNIKKLTNCNYVNVKATTLEKKGLVGTGEGIASEAVVLIKKVI